MPKSTTFGKSCLCFLKQRVFRPREWYEKIIKLASHQTTTRWCSDYDIIFNLSTIYLFNGCSITRQMYSRQSSVTKLRRRRRSGDYQEYHFLSLVHRVSKCSTSSNRNNEKQSVYYPAGSKDFSTVTRTSFNI